MIDSIPDDILRHICLFLRSKHVISILQVCRSLYNVHDSFFKTILYNLYGDEFWNRANMRAEEFHSLTWKKEFIRIERFQNKMELVQGNRWTNDMFYRTFKF